MCVTKSLAGQISGWRRLRKLGHDLKFGWKVLCRSTPLFGRMPTHKILRSSTQCRTSQPRPRASGERRHTSAARCPKLNAPWRVGYPRPTPPLRPHRHCNCEYLGSFYAFAAFAGPSASTSASSSFASASCPLKWV